VALTQKYQFFVIIAGMIAAFVVLVSKLPPGLTLGDAFTVAGGFDKLKAVDPTLSLAAALHPVVGPDRRPVPGPVVFGADQSQVQRYLGGASLRESRLGLMFNAVFKIPMQLFILLLGALIFVFYQFERPPVFFNQTAWHSAAQTAPGKFSAIESDYAAAQAEKQQDITRWLAAKHAGDTARVRRPRRRRGRLTRAPRPSGPRRRPPCARLIRARRRPTLITFSSLSSSRISRMGSLGCS